LIWMAGIGTMGIAAALVVYVKFKDGKEE